MRLTIGEVESMIATHPPGTALEEILGVFEVFASGALADEVYILDDVSGKRIAIAPKPLKERHRASS
jgi:hypothetical protein